MSKNIKLITWITSLLVCALTLVNFIVMFIPVMQTKGIAFINPNMPSLAFDLNHDYTANSNGSRIIPAMLFFIAIAILAAAIYEALCFTFDYFGIKVKGFKPAANSKTSLIVTIVASVILFVLFAVFTFMLPTMVGMADYYNVGGGAITSGILLILIAITYACEYTLLLLKK